MDSILAGMAQQVPQHAQWDGASTINLLVSLVTLASVIFLAGACYQTLQTVRDDVKDLKKDVKAQGESQAEVRGHLGMGRNSPAE